MKVRNIIFAVLAIALAMGCRKEDYGWVKKGIDRAQHQLMLTAEEIDGTGKLPRSIWSGYDISMLEQQLERPVIKDSLRALPSADKLGTRRLCDIYDWTSGFYPGSLW